MLFERNPQRAPERMVHTLADVGTAAFLLSDCYQNGIFASAQKVVDATKKFGMVCEGWLIQNNAISDSEQLEESETKYDFVMHMDAIHAAPSAILLFLTQSGVVHDTFQSAFQLSVDVCYSLNEKSEKENKGAISSELDSVLNNCLGSIEKSSLYHLIDLKRVEALIVFISAFFENYFSVIRMRKDVNTASAALLCIENLIGRMKGAMIDLKAKSMKFSVDGDEILSNEE